MGLPEASHNGIRDYWDHIAEYETDPSWRAACSPEYAAYRERFDRAKLCEWVPEFPISIEIEASYYCNLKCPFCPRVVNEGERKSSHMSQALWEKILWECRDHGLNAILMDHEAESMMNPRFFTMVEEARNAGILDIWLHTNANMLSRAKSERLIDAGLTKINFSIDAQTEATYDVLRVGGNLPKVIRNVKEFLTVKLAKQADYLRTRVSFVEQERNIREKRAFFDFWKSEPGLNVITFQECIDFSPFERPDADSALGPDQLERKYVDQEPFRCSLPWEMPVIDNDGNVMPCGSPVREHSKDFILGNIERGDTIEACWHGDKMKRLRELHTNGEWYKHPMCRVCVNTIRQSRERAVALRESAARDDAAAACDDAAAGAGA